MKNIYNNIEIENFENNKKASIKPVGMSWQETRELSQDTASGEEVSLINVDSNKDIDVFIDGNSEQKTTEGYNLCKSSNYDNSYLKLFFDPTDITDKTITISLETNVELSGNSIYINSPIDAFHHFVATIGGKANERINSTFTLSDDDYASIKKLGEPSFLIYKNEAGFNEIINPQIVLGNIDKSYEPFTGGIPSPNPEYTQDIDVIDGCNKWNKLTSYTTTTGNEYVQRDTPFEISKGIYNLSFDITNNVKVLFAFKNSNDKEKDVYFENTYNKVVTFDDDIKKVAIYIYGTNTTTISNINLIEGSTPKPYLPYGNVGLKFSGINKFNVNGKIQQLSSSNYYTRVENNKLILPYSTGYEQSALFESINVEGGKKYTISCKLEQGIVRLAFRLYDVNNNLISSTIEGATYLDYYKGYYCKNNLTKVTLTLPTNAKYLSLLTINSTTTNNEETILSEIQLKEGEPAPYEPYHEPQVIPVNLNGNTIGKISDTVKDELSIYRNGKVTLLKRLWEDTINTSDLITLSNGNKALVYTTSKKKIEEAGENDYLVSNAQRNKTFNEGTVYQNPANFVFVGNSSDTLETMKEKYNNGQILYQLATSQTIELPLINIPELWEGTVNVELISNLSSNLEVNYNILPAMPSVEAKSDINSVDNVNIRICNENLAYEGWAEDFVSRINNKGRASIVTKDGRKCLYYSPDAGYKDYDNKYLFKTNWKENTQYTFNFDIYLDNKNGYANLLIQYTDGTVQELMNLKSNEWNKVDFKSKVNKTIKYLRVNWRSESTYIDLNTFMVYEGTEISQYIPNKAQKYSLNETLRGIKVTDKTIANYQDENGNYWVADYIDDSGIHRRIGEEKIDIVSELLTLSNGNKVVLITLQNKWYKYITGMKTSMFSKAIYADRASSNFGKEGTYYENEGNFIIVGSTEDTKETMQEKYNNETLLYLLAEEELEEFTEEERNTYEQLQNIQLFEGTNYISAMNGKDKFEINVAKIIDDYYSYISNEGYFIVPEFNIKYLVDFSESDIPTMPEASEATAKVAGRDGDIPLSTTYEPIPFNIVCYTEENLSLSEKVQEEEKVNRLLNSIKNKTMTFALEKSNKFYNVKYSGELTTVNYPKCLKFTIPLKSSESYGKSLMEKMMVGNSTEKSDTIKDVGAIITLGGPATNPIISLNDYSMEYNMSILKGSKVEIDSNKSTVTNINSDGIKTNVMKYYNHQFPKIENGENTLKVLSGFESDKQVSIKWKDLKL